MPADSEQLRKLVRKHLSEYPLGPDEQTRICLFLQGVKSINATILAKVEFQPFDWLPYKFLHNQYFKEIELSTLLGKATQWSSNPFVYMEATNLNLFLVNHTGAARYMQGFFELDRTFYEYLALSHAFMADVRFLPLLPASIPLDSPFLSALKEIEEENGRQIQAQIRLLKDVPVPLEREEKEAIIEQQWGRVEEVYDRFLEELCQLREGH